ncbi:MAG TPA: glycine oxidase ThiO [Candidatus Eremiobacteraceae bacterium]|jgi:glycine oxidase|nr:glycine oxidase ThiO [Candidatus Eremiobacteraceae bacterium]
MKSFDVAIAGAGLIGSSIAFELAQAGLKVGLFDRAEPGREASWASAGILSPAPESPAMISMVPLAKASMNLYPALVANVEEISGEKVGFRPKGTIDVFFNKDAIPDLSTLIALHHGMGLKAEPLRPEDARELEPSLSPELEAAALRPEEASIDNRALTHAMLSAAKNSGVEVFARTGVTGIVQEAGRCTGLKLENEIVSAKWTVIAAGCFSAEIEGVKEFAPVRPAKGQMVSLRADGLKIERVIWGEKIYIVPRNDGRILAGATVEYVGFDKQVTAGGIEKLLSAAIEVIPEFANARIEETWAGLRPDSPDHLPILGPTDIDGLVIATGHFRSGVLLTPITARLVRQWITERSVELDWERLSPMRFIEARRETTA